MSQNLTISSLFSVLALLSLAMVARAGDLARDANGTSIGTGALIALEATAP